jgi:hypothetical protein
MAVLTLKVFSFLWYGKENGGGRVGHLFIGLCGVLSYLQSV